MTDYFVRVLSPSRGPLYTMTYAASLQDVTRCEQIKEWAHPGDLIDVWELDESRHWNTQVVVALLGRQEVVQ